MSCRRMKYLNSTNLPNGASQSRLLRGLPFIFSTTMLCALVFVVNSAADAAEWTIPLAGNAFPTSPDQNSTRIDRKQEIRLRDQNDAFSVYFHADRPAALTLKVIGRGEEENSSVTCMVGQTTLRASLSGKKLAAHTLGKSNIDKPGYVRLDIQRGEQGQSDALVHALHVTSKTKGLNLRFVRSNDGNMFYWGRRGPSVHLRYDVPKDRSFPYAYTEITVPPGQDPIGSFYMANGFGEGYFGFQVNSPRERRVLFSVWSPYKTDNPSDIPTEQRIVVLGRGPDVHIGKFGNEGSGGQSYLVYQWQSGKTYRFLTHVQPDGEGNSIYTSWFGDKAIDEWRLIASFLRPKTNTHLTGFHSFLESFLPNYGHIERRAKFANIWVRDTNDQWHECTRARFSVDVTGRDHHRLDFAGGTHGDHFFLRNCGFFDASSKPGTRYTREATKISPKIDFKSLPTGD